MKTPRINFVVEAFLLIPIASAISLGLLVCLQNDWSSIFLSLFVGVFTFFALIFHEILALPLYLFCHRKGWVNLASTTLGGFIVGAIPAAISKWPDPSLNSFSRRYGGHLVIDGKITANGWHYYLDSVLEFALYGAAYGFAFWLYLLIRSRLSIRARRNEI